MYTPPSPLTVINVNNTRQTLSKQQMHESISTQEQIWHFLSQTRTALELLDNPFRRIHPKTGPRWTLSGKQIQVLVCTEPHLSIVLADLFVFLIYVLLDKGFQVWIKKKNIEEQKNIKEINRVVLEKKIF